jgi:L-ascorbate metabolism protein UlaG (beta-lactamase superfamily)
MAVASSWDTMLSWGYHALRYFAQETLCLGGVTIYRVDAQHGENDEIVTRMGPCSGFVFVCDGEKTIYVAGDTVFYDGVRSVISRFAPDVIIVNACDARVRAGRLIMNAADVKKTCECKPYGHGNACPSESRAA